MRRVLLNIAEEWWNNRSGDKFWLEKKGKHFIFVIKTVQKSRIKKKESRLARKDITCYRIPHLLPYPCVKLPTEKNKKRLKFLFFQSRSDGSTLKKVESLKGEFTEKSKSSTNVEKA
ncbi:unnamed protein product [Angiostrongylus costaricensis]|uniref:Ovule protein n=1 Tax=Angiostrongylus costaricensis TaxID=334426 RepID=A0A0R3PE55_ANGCS|nr:unnamed protein product [Angiostrongylus costaricensis]